MLFTQIEFLFLFAAALLACALVKSNGVLKWLLLLASLYFYAYWDLRFVGLMLGCVTVNYLAGLYLDKCPIPGRRKFVAGLAISLSLLVLAVFKYYGFFVTSVEGAFDSMGLRFPVPEIVLPVGISFFTFQALSYTIDVYRREIPACWSWRDVALYISFFPQLVAGPIVRAKEFMPQLGRSPSLSWQRFGAGGRQFITGLFKKAFIADHLAGYVDHVFANDASFSGATLALALVAYAVQIYCDFSGYSDMAIGAARILGYDFSENFRHPYLATSIQDFWRRWHISLSSWLRDYLYIPLGGNRHGSRRTYINLMLTMALGGLWHGAAWTFVFWGVWHGFWLGAQRAFQDITGRDGAGGESGGVVRLLVQWAATMVVVMVGWLFFRSTSFEQATRILGSILSWSEGVSWFSWSALLCVGLVVLRHVGLVLPGGREAMALLPGRVRTSFALTVMVAVVILFRPEDFQPFIYFQF